MGRSPPGGGAVSSLWGGSCLYEGHIYFERNMGARQDIYLAGTLFI
jgi:hypothetical protein